MSAPDQADNGLPEGTRIVAGPGESLVPAGTPGTVVLAAGETAIWPAVRYDGQAEAVLTDPRWIKPAPGTPSVLALLGQVLADPGYWAEA